uniref:Uncharacterized protein n=1 Tax=Panagrellus redivivus TaxID=6233 RepID=A0A7E4ZSD5_PANRE
MASVNEVSVVVRVTYDNFNSTSFSTTTRCGTPVLHCQMCTEWALLVRPGKAILQQLRAAAVRPDLGYVQVHPEAGTKPFSRQQPSNTRHFTSIFSTPTTLAHEMAVLEGSLKSLGHLCRRRRQNHVMFGSDLAFHGPTLLNSTPMDPRR